MNKRIDIFDLDDTLLVTPSFADFARVDGDGIVDLKHYNGLDEFDASFVTMLNKIKSFFYITFFKKIYFVVIGDFIVLYDSKTKSPLSSEYTQKVQELNVEQVLQLGLKEHSLKDLKRSIGEEDGHVVISNVSGFHENPSTVGRDTNDKVLSDYMNATNRMIVTGRNENLRSVIDKRLFDLGMPFPNFGLFLFTQGVGSVKDYKVATILKSIKENSWEEVHFYEDRNDWLQAVRIAVSNMFPEVKFNAHLIPQTRKL